ncbi:MAG: hypothetical protein Q7T51_03385 [Candidatus Moranbacteria bacterium]|nr:hypothetical protein [Candidatus Moranbacteria bacterium]
MKILIAIFLVLLIPLSVFARDVQVKGYVRKDGTYVQPHYRTAPDSTISNNYSTKGNINPYTGEAGTVDPLLRKGITGSVAPIAADATELPADTATTAIKVQNPVEIKAVEETRKIQANEESGSSSVDKKIKDLEARVYILEHQLETSQSAPVVFTDKWKNLSQWRLLRKAMNYGQVRDLLGEPLSVKAGIIDYWEYPQGGQVTFHLGGVYGWNEPKVR